MYCFRDFEPALSINVREYIKSVKLLIVAQVLKEICNYYAH